MSEKDGGADMTREDIIRLAREVGGADITVNGFTTWVGTQSTEFLERFAALVAAEKDKEIERLREQLRLANIDALNEAAENDSLGREIERLREELRQSSIDHTCAEVERLREALAVAAKAELYDPATGIVDADVLEIVQDTARAALRREDKTWCAA